MAKRKLAKNVIAGKITDVYFEVDADGEPQRRELTANVEYADGTRHLVVLLIDRMTARLPPESR